MDLAAKRQARTERMQAKREAIKAQAEAAAPTEAEEVSEATPEETKTS